MSKYIHDIASGLAVVYPFVRTFLTTVLS